MYNFVDSFNTVQRFRRGFLYTLTETDEPTYLTFSLDFDFENIVVNEFFGLYDSPLFIETPNIDYSAINYLNSIGRIPEAERLKEFKRLLLYTSQRQPWFFQSITGLDKLWKATTDMSNNFKGKDLEFEIETLESLDLRISYMADLYRHAIYDPLYMREIVPENLRQFKIDIYLSEFRNLNTLTESLLYYNTATYNYKRYIDLGRSVLDMVRAGSDYFINNASFFKFSVYFSEFDFSETLPGGGSYNVHSPDMAVNKFKIKGRWHMEENSYDNYRIKTEEYFSKYVQDTPELWSKNKPVTLDGVLTSIGTVYNMAQNLSALGSDLGIGVNKFS